MKRIVNIALAVSVLAAVALGQAQSGGGKKSSSGDATAAIIKIEHEWESAMQNKDDKALGKILLDGWSGIGPDGSTEDKAKYQSEVKDGQYASVKLGDITVKTFGSTAVATGTATDKDGKYAWTDVFIRQAGTWKAVASQIAKVG
jgi:hypothetical protein